MSGKSGVSAFEKFSVDDTRSLRQFWEGLWPFLVPRDVLGMRAKLMVSSLNSRKTEIATSAWEQKISKASCRKRTGEALPQAEKFGDLITTDHKFLVKDVNQETITGTLSWYKILLPNGFNLIRVKQNLHMRQKKSSLK